MKWQRRRLRESIKDWIVGLLVVVGVLICIAVSYGLEYETHRLSCGNQVYWNNGDFQCPIRIEKVGQ